MAQASLSDQEAMCTNFSFPSHGNKILQGLNKQRLDSSLCDVTITVQGQQYKAHKSVLAAYSPYFHGMFTVNWLSSEGDLVMELDGVTSRAFDSLLKLIYTSVLTVSPTIISEVVSAATYLDMPDVVAVCNQYMEKNVTPRIADAKVYGAGSAGLEVGDSDDDDVGTEPAIFANAEDDWTVNLQDISSAARTGEAGMKPVGGEETASKPAKKKRRWKDEHGSFTCETCGKLYTSRASYRTHMYGHRSGKKHTCKAARAKVVKAGIVKVKKKKRRSPTRDPIDGSIKCCTCGAFGTDTGGDRCGSGRCPCYRHYKTCGPKCICKRCINDVPVAKPEQVAPGLRCNCGKNDKKRGNESSSKQRCSMNIRCVCFKASRPCGRYCRCVNCGNKGDDSDTTAQGPPNGDTSLAKEGLTPKLFVKPAGKHSVKAAKGSVADMLEKMRTSGTACEKESSEGNAGKDLSKTSTEDQTKRAEKSLPVQISKTAEEQAVIASQDSRNARDGANADAQTIDAAAEVASAVAGIQASQAETVTPLPAGQIPLSSSQIPPAESCSCGKNDKNRGDKSSVQRCSMNVRCACYKAHRSCGLNCRCVNCGNKADGTQGHTKGDASLVKEGLDPEQQVDRNVGKRAAVKGSVAEMLEKMRTSGTTYQKETSKTTDTATEAASAVAGIQSSQAQAESVVRPLPAVRVPLSHPQPPALGGTLKWLCLPDGSLVNPVKVTGTVRFVSSNNNAALPSTSGSQPPSNTAALPSTSGSQPPNNNAALPTTSGSQPPSNTAALPTTSGSQPPSNTANTDSQPTQKTSEPGNRSSEEQRADQDARDVENKSPEAGAVSSSDDGHDDENMERGSPTSDKNAETSEGILPSTAEAAAVAACDNDGDVDNARSSIESDKTRSLNAAATRTRTRSISSTQILESDSQQTSKEQSTAEESQSEDHQQTSSSKERAKRRAKRGRASAKRPSEGPSQSLQPTIVLKRLRLRSSRVNVNEVETMEENASNKTGTPSQSSVGATSVDTRESGDSERHPSKKRHEGRAPKARKRQRKSYRPVGKEDAAKEAATKPGPESEADAAKNEAQADVGTWSSRLRKDRKRTWKSGSGEWITDDSGEELSDDSLEKDYTADSDSSSDEEEVETAEEDEEEEETEEKRLERRKKTLMKMQRSGPKKVQPNTIGDLLEKGENPNKSLQDIIQEQESKQTRKQRPKTSKSKTRGPRPKKTAAIPVRQLLNLKSSGKEKAPKEIPSWLEEWKKSLSPGTKHTPGGKGDRNKTGEGGGGSTSRVSVEPNDQAGSSGPSTQDQVAVVPVAPHAGTGDGQSAADQPATMSTVDSTQIAQAAQQ